jgi:hypothetical protein
MSGLQRHMGIEGRACRGLSLSRSAQPDLRPIHPAGCVCHGLRDGPSGAAALRPIVGLGLGGDSDGAQAGPHAVAYGGVEVWVLPPP